MLSSDQGAVAEQPASSSVGPEQTEGLDVPLEALGELAALGALASLEPLEPLDPLEPPESLDPLPPLDPLLACAMLSVVSAGAA
jgi:hypothetical protein